MNPFNSKLPICRPSTHEYRLNKNDPTRIILEAFAEKLRDLKAFEKHAVWKHTDFRWMTLQTGIGMDVVGRTLKQISTSVYIGGYFGEDDYFSEEVYYCVTGAGITWQKGNDFFEIIVDDFQKLRGFINSYRGMEYSVYPHEIQTYRSLTFDFTLNKIFHYGTPIKNLGEKSAPLAKILLENRDYRFSYLELAKILGEENLFQQSASRYSFCRRIDKVFERLNKDCKTKIFHYKENSVLVIEPCRSDVGDV